MADREVLFWMVVLKISQRSSPGLMCSCFNHVINAIYHTIVLWPRSLSDCLVFLGLTKPECHWSFSFKNPYFLKAVIGWLDLNILFGIQWDVCWGRPGTTGCQLDKCTALLLLAIISVYCRLTKRGVFICTKCLILGSEHSLTYLRTQHSSFWTLNEASSNELGPQNLTPPPQGSANWYHNVGYQLALLPQAFFFRLCTRSKRKGHLVCHLTLLLYKVKPSWAAHRSQNELWKI